MNGASSKEYAAGNPSRRARQGMALVVTRASVLVFVTIAAAALLDRPVVANPWTGKVVFQAFWWDAWTERHPQDWYTYLAKLAPRLRELGFDGIWIPSPPKGNAGTNSMGYDVFDHYDLGDKDQKGTIATRFGTKDSLLRLVAVAYANGLEVYPDIVLNHAIGAELDPAAPGLHPRRTSFEPECAKVFDRKRRRPFGRLFGPGIPPLRPYFFSGAGGASLL